MAMYIPVVNYVRTLLTVIATLQSQHIVVFYLLTLNIYEYNYKLFNVAIYVLIRINIFTIINA